MASNTDSTPKRQLVLQAATELFLSQGFDGTNMDQIAINAQVSKQTVYSHFGGKEALFMAVIESKCQQHDITEDLFSLDLPVRDVLESLAQHYTDLILSEEAIRLHRVCVSGGEKYSRIAELYWQGGPQWLQGKFAEYLAKKHDNGLVDTPNATHAAQQFLYMLKGEVHLRKMLDLDTSSNEHENIQNYIESCINMFEKAYLIKAKS